MHHGGESWLRKGSALQRSMETCMGVGEDGRKVREVPSCGGTMHSSLRGLPGT